MSNKEQLINAIKSWITIDGKMKQMQSEMKKMREEKKRLTNSLVEVMRDNEIDCFDVKDGKMIYTRRKVKAPINKKTLQKTLEGFFKDKDIDFTDEAVQYILENREENIKETIRLKEEK
jgi:uncharacterized protein (UPF0335 family)